MSAPASSTTAPFVGLVDDAAIFPPGDQPVVEAVPAHLRHLSSWYGGMVGPFVCSDRRLPELQQSLPDEPADRLAVSITVSGGAGAVEPAVTWVSRDGRLSLAAVEVALRDEEDLAHNARRLTTVLAQALPADARAFVEMPRLLDGAAPSVGWLEALDEVAASGHAAKFRTGGLDADAFPASSELAAMLAGSLDREVPFKCTAGLHNAVRHTASDTGFEHQGFLNVMLATRAILDGATSADIEELLETRDPEEVQRGCTKAGVDALVSARSWFLSFGSCSIDEPVHDLVELGLLEEAEG